jgi:hypothetical protein
MLKFYPVNSGNKEVRSDQFVCFWTEELKFYGKDDINYLVKAELRNGKKVHVMDLFDDPDTAKNEMRRFSAQIEEDMQKK